MHEEKVNLGNVVDEEGLVARRHHVAGLPVGTVTNLYELGRPSATTLLRKVMIRPVPYSHFLVDDFSFPCPSSFLGLLDDAHLWHGSLALEASADTVVDTLGLSPARVDAHEAVRLVAVEARSACRRNILSATVVLPLSFSFPYPSDGDGVVVACSIQSPPCRCSRVCGKVFRAKTYAS